MYRCVLLHPVHFSIILLDPQDSSFQEVHSTIAVFNAEVAPWQSGTGVTLCSSISHLPELNLPEQGTGTYVIKDQAASGRQFNQKTHHCFAGELSAKRVVTTVFPLHQQTRRGVGACNKEKQEWALIPTTSSTFICSVPFPWETYQV